MELQEPFKSLWNKGYLYINNENRRTISLSGNSASFTMTYARYLMCVKLGYILPTELEVDHVDNDKTNDNISNLQVLTKQQNLEKANLYYLTYQQNSYGYHCAYCELPFIITERDQNMRLAQNVELAFCSRSCASTYHAYNNPNYVNAGISDKDKNKIKELRKNNLSSYKISELTGFARNTVMKYW